jgi:hypothetical protein
MILTVLGDKREFVIIISNDLIIFTFILAIQIITITRYKYILPNEDINISWLWLAMSFRTIGLTILFNMYIFPTEFILRILHGIQIDIKSILFR